MDFIQSGEPPEALGDGEKVIRTLPRPYPHKLIRKLLAATGVLYLVPSVGFAIGAVLAASASTVALLSVLCSWACFLLGMLGFQLLEIASGLSSKSRVTDQFHVFEFRVENIKSSRTDGTGFLYLSRYLHAVTLVADEAIVWFDPFHLWGFTPTDLENPADWPQLVDWWIECGALKPKLRDKVLALANKPPR